MKPITLLTRSSVALTAVSALAFALNVYVASAFTLAASSLLLLIAARDYAKPARRWQPALSRSRTTPASRRAQSLRLAA